MNNSRLVELNDEALVMVVCGGEASYGTDEDGNFYTCYGDPEDTCNYFNIKNAWEGKPVTWQTKGSPQPNKKLAKKDHK